MTVITAALYLDLNATFGADELGRPYRDLIGEGIVATTGTPANQLKVTQRAAGANLSVDVASGAAWIKGDTSALQPTYRVYNDATVNLAIAAADATNPRLDIVVLEVLDSTFSGVSDLAQLRVVTGTPAASPSAPATPDTALLLATVSVPALDTTIADAQITGNRVYATVGGGELYGRSSEQINAVDALQTTNAIHTVYQDLATVGPQLTVNAGTYILEASCEAANTVAGNVSTVGYKIGALGITVDFLIIQANVANNFLYATRKTAITVTADGTLVKLQYKSSAATVASFAQRWLTLTRVG